jgi:2-octaprenylphenol hydroxylase
MYDLIIIGSGIVGLMNALLLAQNTPFKIAILDAKVPRFTWSAADYDSRVYAITPASQQLLKKLALWSTLEAKRLSPFMHLSVWDAAGGGEIHFNHAELQVPVLGYILEENLLRGSLLEKLQDYPQLELLCPLQPCALEEREEFVELQFANAKPLRTKLLIGADGAESWVREAAGFDLRITAYQHSSLIAQVQTELPHEYTARQVFLSGKGIPAGPLAFLPLADVHQSSIVWSTLPAEAEHLLQLDDKVFQQRLGEAFGFRLGQIVAVTKRHLFPLYERHVTAYVKNRLALLGDAAHSLHPLAGQGLNLGIADAACLAEVIIQAYKKGRDFSSRASLRRYERARKGNNALMLSTVKLLKNLFAREEKSLQQLRSHGLRFSNRLSIVKALFARYAMS